MRYLLSNGTTNNVVEYVHDILDLHFSMEYMKIPYLDMGMNSLINDLRLDQAEVIVREKVNKVISRINRRNKVNLTMDSIKVNRGSIELSLRLGNSTIKKEI